LRWRIIGEIFVIDRRQPLFNAVVRHEPLNLGLRWLTSPRN